MPYTGTFRMRLFTGIAIPPEVTAQLVQAMDSVRSLPGLRFVAPEKLHLTTTFIGEWPEERLKDMQDALAAVDVRGPIEIRVARVGWLPSPRFPRVLYAGVYCTDALQRLASTITQAVIKAGAEQDERRWYRPHITLARVHGRPALDPSPNAEIGEIGAFQATSFFLYLSADGKYTKLQEFFLLDS